MSEFPKVSVLLPIIIRHEWQRLMTETCIEIMRCTTKVPFELIIIETESDCFKKWFDNLCGPTVTLTKYVHHPEVTTMVRDLNSGIEVAEGEFIVHTGNDIYPQDGWLEAMLDCFNLPDCGAACLAASDMKQVPLNKIEEGIYGPCMMFRSGWLFDTDYESIMSDTDLIMRIYQTNKKMYRNWRVLVGHFGRITHVDLYGGQHLALLLQKAQEIFAKKHGDCGLVMFRLLASGTVL